jgi:hypothetical protein
MIFIVLVVLCFPAGRSLYKSTWAPYFFFFLFHSFLVRFKDKGSKRFSLTAPPAAGIPTYFLRPRKKNMSGHSFILLGGEISNFIGYFSFYDFIFCVQTLSS